MGVSGAVLCKLHRGPAGVSSAPAANSCSLGNTASQCLPLTSLPHHSWGHSPNTLPTPESLPQTALQEAAGCPGLLILASLQGRCVAGPGRYSSGGASSFGGRRTAGKTLSLSWRGLSAHSYNPDPEPSPQSQGLYKTISWRVCGLAPADS